jgi:hypothetical protein
MALINDSAMMTKTRAYPRKNHNGLSDSQACHEHGSVVVVADGAIELVTRYRRILRTNMTHMIPTMAIVLTISGGVRSLTSMALSSCPVFRVWFQLEQQNGMRCTTHRHLCLSDMSEIYH